jgi:iron complex outermembrane receptor protein
VASKYYSDRVRDRTFFTPRARWQHGLGAYTSETVVGFDYYDGNVDSTNRGGPNQSASQTSSAIYAQNITGLTDHLNLTVGGRGQRVKQEADQDAYAAWFSPAMSGSATRGRSAFDLGLTYAKDEWRVYGKTGTTFRFPNVDELFGSDAFGAPVFAGDLRPQHGTINEIGGQIRGSNAGIRGAIYQLDLKDEIGYDGALFANTNFDPTRRKGFETEADWSLTKAVTFKGSYTYIDATFTEGAYSGKEIPLVPKHQGSLQAILNTGVTGTFSGVLRYTGGRRYGSDFTNTHGMLDGYTTVDLQAEWDIKPWRVTAKVLNATDKKYAPFAGYSSSKNDTYYYPADGRAFYLTGRYNF